MKKRRRKKYWITRVADKIGKDITYSSFMNMLVEVGKDTKDEDLKGKMRRVYKKLKDDGAYWEKKIKRKIVKERGWNIFHPMERGDRPPTIQKDFSKGRITHCYKCSGSLYSDIHHTCKLCNWLICPYDLACGCEFKKHVLIARK